MTGIPKKAFWTYKGRSLSLQSWWRITPNHLLAREAFDYADAMMAERAKRRTK